MTSTEVMPPVTRSRGIGLMAVAAAIYLVLRLTGFHQWFVDDSEGIGALLQIIGTLYSVVYAFAA